MKTRLLIAMSVAAAGLVLAPAFVDPHVHLRTPGREDEESMASGTRAAAAGGFCAILAMPNTEPVVDSAAVLGALIERDFGSADAWRADLRATGMGGRGWAWTAYDWDEGRLFNYIGDAQNTFPVWNATPLVALDVYEHAYFLDFQTDRDAYIDAFFNNLDWNVVNDWVSRYQIPLK